MGNRGARESVPQRDRADSDASEETVDLQALLAQLQIMASQTSETAARLRVAQQLEELERQNDQAGIGSNSQQQSRGQQQSTSRQSSQTQEPARDSQGQAFDLNELQARGEAAAQLLALQGHSEVTAKEAAQLHSITGLELLAALAAKGKEAQEEEELQLAMAMSLSMQATPSGQTENVNGSDHQPSPSQSAVPQQRQEYQGLELDEDAAKTLLEEYQKNRESCIEGILVYRDNLFEIARLQVMVDDFNVNASPHIKFHGEEGLDFGGPKREFFRDLLKTIQTTDVFEGNPKKATFTYNLDLLHENKYYAAGVMVGWAVLHTGVGISCIHPYVYSQMVGDRGPDPPVQVEDVPDYGDQENINKLSKCTNESQFRAVTTELFDWMCQCGVMPATLKFKDKDQAVQKLIKHHLYHRVKAAADQFANGLDRSGFLSLLKKNADAGRSFFVYPRKKLTAEAFMDMVQFAVSTSDAKKATEVQTILILKRFLLNVEQGKHSITMSNILEFITGSSTVPPGGFDKQITIHFHDSEECRYPICSTCSFQMSLPTGLNLATLSEVIQEGILSSPGFGMQ